MSFRIVFLMGVALFSVSTSSLVVRHLADVPAVVIAFWRMAIASGFLWIYSFYHKNTLSSLNRKRVFYSGVLLGFHFALFFGAVKLTSIANATVLGTLAPIFTLFVEKFIYRRSFNKVLILGLVISLVGAFVINGNQFSFNNEPFVGNLMAILGSLCIALSWMIAEKVREGSSAITYSRSVFFVAAVVLFLISTFRNEAVLNINLQHLSWFVFLGLVPTIFGHVVLSFILKFVSPTMVASIPLGEPIVASGLALILFNESFSIATLSGGALTLVGLYFIIREQVSRISS